MEVLVEVGQSPNWGCSSKGRKEDSRTEIDIDKLSRKEE
jgi:hypothetical protein